MTDPRARLFDPDTSWEAAYSVENVRDKQKAVYWMLKTHGPLHDEELIRRMKDQTGSKLIDPKSFQQSDSGIRSRRAELVKLGLVERTGEYTVTKTGRRSIIWRAK